MISTGNLDHRVEIIAKDEIGELSSSFNEMTKELKESYQTLEKEVFQHERAEEEVKRLNEELEQQIIQRTLELNSRSHDLGERVKELNCLYNISKLVEKKGISVDEIFEGTVDLIPPSWQYPEITCACITFRDREFKTSNFKKEKWTQTSPIRIHDEPEGLLEVVYLEKRVESDEGPFLKEERKLIDAVSERLGKIVERVQAEEDNEKILRTALEGFWIADKQGRILEVNNAYCRMTGYSREELLNRSISDFESIDSPMETAKRFEEIMKTGSDLFQSRHKRKDGQVIDIEVSANFMDSRGGRFFAFLRDTSDRKKAENELKLAKEAAESANLGKSQFLANNES